MTITAIEHIELDERGVAWIAEANVKVIEIVLDKLAYGWSPEEIHFQQPHLSMGQIHAALAYYYDHQVEFDSEVIRQLAEVRTMADAVKDSPGRARLRSGKVEFLPL